VSPSAAGVRAPTSGARFTGIDFGEPGKHLGYGHVVHSDNVHDGAVIPVPVAVISSGPGPTVLLVAGTHGDEYEGQVLLHELIRNTLPGQLSGTLIVVPAANSAAVRAGTRVSPIDGGNLNRSYPGSAAGGPTAQTANLVAGALLPLADAVVDLHSGGTNSSYLPCTFLYRGPDPALWEQKVHAARLLGLPYVMVVPARLEPGSLSCAGDDAGILSLSTELSGRGTVDRGALELIRAGLPAFLQHVGVLQEASTGVPLRAAAHEPVWIELVPEAAVTSKTAGILEPLVDLGDHVSAGDVVARVHFIDELDREPVEYRARVDGVVAILRHPSLVTVGTHLVHIAPEVPSKSL
jgi:predicted deacylase